MYQRLSVFSLVTLIATLSAGCGKNPASFSAKDLNGHWKGNLEKSWKISKDDFMKDTLRGEDAYPSDEAEKAEIVKKEFASIINNMEYRFSSENEFEVFNNGQSQASGTYKSERQEDGTLKLTLTTTPKENRFSKDGKTSSRTVELSIKFDNRKSIQLTMEGVTIAFDRESE